MKALTISEAKECKSRLESKIFIAIQEFENETDLGLDSIELHQVQHVKKRYKTTRAVTVEVRL